MFKQTCKKYGNKGYKVVCGETVWAQEKAKSASAKKRTNKFIEQYLFIFIFELISAKVNGSCFLSAAPFSY
ncbi:hypothetical protein PspKH34_18050 [Parageobacillus sp. KH3-4]|uniref:Uncharacterized protein n=1 Tax=Parageobacillus thermoglucosidasius TaxID=1426 RepID=A0A1B7KS89_PARTM|nr:hypothetical protein [Parageobacillus thermoglucosidasius]OAT72955.1 hypothetical protein A7K69_08480 [Parageobacillus thermoglucosidasius]BDG47244.1 hypothetical protein PspKH34_18050 [Parageobacillus sp. KH3-4]